MDFNELVKAIAGEVLKQLNAESEKECVLVLANREPVIESKVMEDLDEDKEIFFLNDDPKNLRPCRHILPRLTCELMADLALGRAGDSLASQVLKLLLSGVEVEVLEFEYKDYLKTAPGPMLEMYEGYEKKLASFGLKGFAKKVQDRVRLNKKLVTEKDIIEADEKGAKALWIPENANVTPLAMETAKEMNLELVKL